MRRGLPAMKNKFLHAFFFLALTYCTANAAAPVTLVEVINFDCPVCRSVDAHTETLRRAVEATGGTYRIVAFPTDEQSMPREHVYYQAREIGLEAEAREAFFSAQGSVYFTTETQAVEWLQQRLNREIDVNALNQSALRAREALRKTAHLLKNAGANGYPAYIFINDLGAPELFVPGNGADVVTSIVSEIQRRKTTNAN